MYSYMSLYLRLYVYLQLHCCDCQELYTPHTTPPSRQLRAYAEQREQESRRSKRRGEGGGRESGNDGLEERDGEQELSSLVVVPQEL